jgi:autotransporter strand-loop-strand O-heptosyltransferase
MKIVLLCPSLSTGGMPQFALKRVQEILKHTSNIEMYCIELNFHGADFVVQRNQIIDILGDRFYEAGEDKMRVMDIINEVKPDIVHIEDVAERLPRELATALYNNSREYRIVETPHDVIFNPDADKLFHPDLYAFCTPFHEDVYASMDSKYFTIQYPIEEKKVTDEMKLEAKKKVGFALDRKTALQVGLWTPQKNQKETIAIARKFPNIDFVVAGNMAGNFQFYWEDLIKDLPSNFKALGERSDIDTLLQASDIFIFPSTNECSPLSLRHAIEVGLPIVANNLPSYEGTLDKYIKPLDSDLNTITRDYKIPNSNNSRRFALDHEKMYETILKFSIRKQSVQITQNFISQPFLEIKGISNSDFKVQFLDEKGSIAYENTIKANSWVKLNRQYYTRWTAKVWQDGELIYSNTLNLEGKEVLITIDSKALGDTMAFIPYCEAFQEKHKCKVTVSTFWNKILDYPNLKLIEPGQSIGCYMMLHLGYFHDSDKEPVPANKVPLQQSACNILGLDYVELVPKVKVNRERLDLGRYVAIATNSTAQCKFWTRDQWQILINHLHSKGYRVINVSRETNPFDNCEPILNTSIEYTMQVIAGAEFMVGLSSGLSWLSFAIGTHVVLIANFTAVDYEFSTNCTRIVNPKVCHDCWSDHKLDAANWNWCPRNQNFICHTSITAQMVIDKLPL